MIVTLKFKMSEISEESRTISILNVTFTNPFFTVKYIKAVELFPTAALVVGFIKLWNTYNISHTILPEAPAG